MLLASLVALAPLLLPLPHAPTPASTNGPVVDFQSALEVYFDDESGLISLGEFNIVFAPEGPCTAEVAVIDAEGNVLARHGTYEDYRYREGVFGRAQLAGPADVKLSEPGVYSLVFMNGGEPITRLPFVLEQTSAGDDPFNPVETYRFDGLWRIFGHLTFKTTGDEPVPELTLWLGGVDLADGETRGDVYAEVYRDGELVGHSKRGNVVHTGGHFERQTISLFHPHTEKERPNARFLTRADLSVDGEYEIRVGRQSDNQLIRNFHFTATDGAIQHHPRSALDLDPRIDLIVPRIPKKGASSFEFTEAIWIESR